MRSSTGATQVLPRRDETFLHNPSLVKKYFFCRLAAAVWALCDTLTARLAHVGALGDTPSCSAGLRALSWCLGRYGCQLLAHGCRSLGLSAPWLPWTLWAYPAGGEWPVAAPCRVAPAAMGGCAPRPAPRGACCRTVRKFGFGATSSYSIRNWYRICAWRNKTQVRMVINFGSSGTSQGALSAPREAAARWSG